MLEDAVGNIETMMTSESDEKSESDKIMEKLEDFGVSEKLCQLVF